VTKELAHSSSFSSKCFTKNNMTVIPNPPTLLTWFGPFFHLKIKLKGRHFDTDVVMEAEL
jgi:hypothetical protein